MAKTTPKTADQAPAQAEQTATESIAARAMQISVKRVSETAKIPVYQTAGAACFDLHADTPPGFPPVMTLPAGGSIDIPTGLAFEIPPGFCMRIYSRSGHGFRSGVRLANCVGVIDSDYRGEVRVKLTNDGRRDMTISYGDRIAQAEIAPVFRAEFVEAEELTTTERGEAGLGSTGV